MSYAFVENKSQFGPDEQAGNDTSFSPTTYPRLQIAGSNAAGQVILAPPNFTVYGFAGVAYLDSPTGTYNGFFNDTGIISVRGYTPVAVTSSLVLSAAATSSGGNTVYTGTIINGGSNAYAGMYFTTTGFSNSGNNVSFVQCVASSATTLTLINAGGVAESHVATASVANNWIISGMEVGFEVEPTAVDMANTYPGCVTFQMDILAPVEVSTTGETDCIDALMYPNLGSAPAAATITNVGISSDVLTVATSSNTFYPGQTVVFTNVGTATFLDNVPVQIVTATSSQITAVYTHANYGPASDTGNVLSAQTHFWTRNVYTEMLLGDGTSTPQYWNIFRVTNFAANSIGFLGSGAQGHIGQSYAVSVEGPRENSVGSFGTRAAVRIATQHGVNDTTNSNFVNESWGIYEEDNDLNALGSIYLGGAFNALMIAGTASPDTVVSAIQGSMYLRTPSASKPTLYVKTQNTALSLTLASVATSSSSVAVYTGTIGGSTNTYKGYYFTITGFTNSQNNGFWKCVASSATTLTLTNWNAITESHAATAAAPSAAGWTPVNPVPRAVTTTDAATNDDGTLLCSGTFTETLPNTGIYPGKKFVVKNTGIGVVTVSSAANIDGSTSAILNVQYQSITVEWDGTQYWIE